MTLGVTGHRPNKLGNEYDYKGPYSKYIRERLREQLIIYKPDRCVSGMALGVDTIFALLCLDMGIKLTAAIPCFNQDARWSKASKELYHQILAHPLVTVHYVTEGPYNSTCMQKRNIWMVDRLNVLLAVWNGTPGGTKNCIDYATGKIPIEYINI